MSIARFVFAGLAAVALTAGAGMAADPQSQIQGAYDRQCNAVRSKDGGAFEATLSPDFVAVDLDRNQQTRDDVAGAIVVPPQSMIVETCTFLIRQIQTGDATSTVAETQTMSGTLVSDAAVKPFVRVEDSYDVWKITGRPLQLSSKETGVRLTVDGNVVQDRGILASPEP